MQARRWMELWAATFLATFLLEVAASPSPYAGFSLDDVRRPVYRGNLRTRELKADAEVIVKSDISVVGAEDGRAASSITLAPTTPTPVAESLKTVTRQLLQAPGATDMVATDIRTPPKVKSQVKQQESVNADFVPLGKGEAQPVADVGGYEIITAPPVAKHSTSPTEGLSTWILLSNGDQSTLPSSKKKVASQPTPDPKKAHKPTMATPTIEKVKKPEDLKVSKPLQIRPTALPLKKQNVTKEKEDPPKSTIILQDPKFKNKTPVIVGKIPSVQDKTETTSKKVNATQSTTPYGILTRRRPITLSPTPPTRHFDLVPTTSLLLETGTIETAEDSSTTESSSTAKTSTKRPSANKNKKKKNKNRRRRPAKPDSETAESKVQETSVAPNTKIESNARPISTRIYNYLAREVMPSVGVGLVGLVLTAGLAGLFLYPFGGGIARRNYDKGSGPASDHQMYYYNSYAPPSDHSLGNSQPEESSFGQVLSSMSQNSYSPSYSNKYSTNNKYRYDASDYSQKENDYNVNGYAGSSDYSTLPDSVKHSDYGIKTNYDSPKIDEYAAKTADYPVKNSEFSKSPDYAIKPSDYVGKTDYTAHESIKNTDYVMPEASKYYSMDPISSHYKLTDGSSNDNFKHEDQGYPSLTEYSSYTNAASVGTPESYGHPESDDTKSQAVPPAEEDKSDKSQPHFSALIGSPQFTNTDFVGSVSLTSGYGAHDDTIIHRTGALAAEHGPRSLKINEDNKKARRRRDVHDDFSNEIELTEDKTEFKKPSTLRPLETTETISETSTAKYLTESTTGNSKDAITTTTAEDLSASSEGHNSDVTTARYPSYEGNKGPAILSEEPDSSLTPGSSSDNGILGFITRLAHMKLKLGISFLRTTGETLTRYMDVVAKRMEEVVRTMENRKQSVNLTRHRRDVYNLSKKPITPKKFRKHLKNH